MRPGHGPMESPQHRECPAKPLSLQRDGRSPQQDSGSQQRGPEVSLLPRGTGSAGSCLHSFSCSTKSGVPPSRQVWHTAAGHQGDSNSAFINNFSYLGKSNHFSATQDVNVSTGMELACQVLARMHTFEVKGLAEIYPLHLTPPSACSSEQELCFRRRGCDLPCAFSTLLSTPTFSMGFHSHLPFVPPGRFPSL